MSKCFFLLVLLGWTTGDPRDKRSLHVHVCSNQESYSWIVSIQRNESHKCNGLIIDDRTILTTAFCCEERLFCSAKGPNPLLKVIYFLNFVRGSPVGENCEVVGVDRCIKHERYARWNYTAQYDTAVVKLKEGLKKPILSPLYYHKLTPMFDECLYRGDYSEICKKGTVVGRWLHDQQTVPNSPLECFFVTIRHIKECDNQVKFQYFTFMSDETLTCSFDLSNRHEVCSTFYGAPLMCDDRVVGLVSHKFNFSDQCEQVSPFFYSRIDYSLDFIRANAKKFQRRPPSTTSIYSNLTIEEQEIRRACSPRFVPSGAFLVVCLFWLILGSDLL